MFQQFRFNDYVDDTLIISKLTSRLLTIKTKGFCALDYVVIFRNKYNTDEYQKKYNINYQAIKYIKIIYTLFNLLYFTK